MTERKIRLLIMVFLALTAILSFNAITASAQESNVGICRVYSFDAPNVVAPNSTFNVTVDVEYALHGRPDNATIRADIYEGEVNFNEPLWQSDSVIVHQGGDQVWNVSLTSLPAEGYMNLTAYAYFLEDGAWNFYNNSLNGPGFSQVTIRVAKTANLDIQLGIPDLSLTVDNLTVTTSAYGHAHTTLLPGSIHIISVPSAVEFQNSTRIVFSGWNDGINQTRRRVVLDGNLNLTGSYKVQYQLRVNSIGSANLEWYDAGSSVELQQPDSFPMSGLLGLLGLKYDFLGWTGSLNSASPHLTITMNTPKILTANYSSDYRPLAVPAILMVGGISGVVLLLNRRREKTSHEAESNESTSHCSKCGEEIETGWSYCIKCGADLKTSESTEVHAS